MFKLPTRPLAGARVFDVTRDGKRFVVRTLVPAEPQPLTVLVNWMAKLRRSQ